MVRDYCGQGIGKVFHTEPNVLHYKKKYSEYIDEYTKKMKQKYEEYLAKEKINQNKNKPLTQEQFNELQKKSLTQEQFNERQKSSDIILEEGMFFTIEPMINAGKYETILSKHDDWTVSTRDKSLSAQFEHTVGVTKNGYEIFTISKNE